MTILTTVHHELAVLVIVEKEAYLKLHKNLELIESIEELAKTKRIFV